MKTSFKVWIRSHRNEDSPIGDLARDIEQDKRFPVARDGRKMFRYLESRCVGIDAKLAFLQAYKAYREEQS